MYILLKFSPKYCDNSLCKTFEYREILFIKDKQLSTAHKWKHKMPFWPPGDTFIFIRIAAFFSLSLVNSRSRAEVGRHFL